VNQNRTGLVAPYSGKAGDGNANVPELTAADEIREQIEAPARDARAGALRDATAYLVHNATSGADGCINVRQAVNIRWNLPWTVVDAVIREAQPLAELEIERVNAERSKIEQERATFDNLTALFSKPVRVKKSRDKYDLLGLTEAQLRSCAAVLNE
jgi:hypothetical protein